MRKRRKIVRVFSNAMRTERLYFEQLQYILQNLSFDFHFFNAGSLHAIEKSCRKLEAINKRKGKANFAFVLADSECCTASGGSVGPFRLVSVQPCWEVFLLYHCIATAREFDTCGQVLTELRKIRPYDKKTDMPADWLNEQAFNAAIRNMDQCLASNEDFSNTPLLNVLKTLNDLDKKH